MIFVHYQEVDLFRKFFGKKALPLSGVPAIRRLKTYSAQSGYAYQYFYQGHRPGTEFVFSVSADRKSWQEVTVTVQDADVCPWEQSHGRTLSATERYALAKMALFTAFDERPAPADMKWPVQVRAADVSEIIEKLGLE